MNKMINKIVSILPLSGKVYAHCDIPCGIYDPKPAQIAAATVLKMVQKIKDLSLPDFSKKEEVESYQNSMTRMIWTKEEHAQKCKEEILILWTDYFKPQHLEKFSALHDIFWKAAKLCSANKQEVSLEHAQMLVKSIDEIADIFQKSKQEK